MNEVTTIDQTEAQVAPVMQGNTLPADPMVAMIEKIAMNPDLPIERLTAIMDMRERQMNKQAEQEFNLAFAQAMAEMPDVPKSGKNNHSGQRYSTLDDLIRATRPALSRHGLSLNWQTSIDGDQITVTAVVRHAQGHSIQTTLTGKRDSGKAMNALQGGGSTETYLKRYSGFGILGLSSGDEVDNDGRKESPKPITEEQFFELRDLIETAGITEDVVCNAKKINALPELPAEKFEKVRDELNVIIQKKEAA